jgi:hypothetical protein
MKEYRILYGAYVRMYADHTVLAENNDAARQLAIEEFKTRAPELQWVDPNYDNLALPSICCMQIRERYGAGAFSGPVLEGYDFPITAADSRRYGAEKMLATLEFVRMTFSDLEAANAKVISRNARKSWRKPLPKRRLRKPPATAYGETAMTPLKNLSPAAARKSIATAQNSGRIVVTLCPAGFVGLRLESAGRKKPSRSVGPTRPRCTPACCASRLNAARTNLALHGAAVADA